MSPCDIPVAVALVYDVQWPVLFLVPLLNSRTQLSVTVLIDESIVYSIGADLQISSCVT